MAYRQPPANWTPLSMGDPGGKFLEVAGYIVMAWATGHRAEARARWDRHKNSILKQARNLPGRRARGESYNWAIVCAAAGYLAGNASERKECGALIAEFVDRQLNPRNPEFHGLGGHEINSTTYYWMVLGVLAACSDSGSRAAKRWLDLAMLMLSVFRCTPRKHWSDRSTPRVWSPGMRCGAKNHKLQKDLVDGSALAASFAALLEGGSPNPGHNPWKGNRAWWPLCCCLASEYRIALDLSDREAVLREIARQQIRLSPGLSLHIVFNAKGDYTAWCPHRHTSTPSLFAVTQIAGRADAIVLNPPGARGSHKGVALGNKIKWSIEDGRLEITVLDAMLGGRKPPPGVTVVPANNGRARLSRSIRIPSGHQQHWVIDSKGVRQLEVASDESPSKPVPKPDPKPDDPTDPPEPKPVPVDEPAAGDDMPDLPGDLLTTETDWLHLFLSGQLTERVRELLETVAEARAEFELWVSLVERLANSAGGSLNLGELAGLASQLGKRS